MDNISEVPAAGWHEDPEDPDFTRYSDGKSWRGNKVPKKRNLTLDSSKVYRPGNFEEAYAPVREAKSEKKTVGGYQPMTRRERRKLEEAQTIGQSKAGDLFDDEFEFQAAPVTTGISYAPGNGTPVQRSYSSPTEDEVQPADDPSVNEDAFVAEEVSFVPEAASFDEQDEESHSSLPELDFGGEPEASSAPSSQVTLPVESDEDNDSGLPELGLPELGFKDQTDDEELPSPVKRIEAVPVSDDAEPEDNEDDEFASFTSSAKEPELKPLTKDSDDFGYFAADIKEDDNKDEVEANDDTDYEFTSQLHSFDDTDDAPKERKPYAFAPPAPVVEAKEDEVSALEAKPVEEDVEANDVVAAEADLKKDVKAADKEEDESELEDVQPVFGFKSKLDRDFKGGNQSAHEVAETAAAFHTSEKTSASKVESDEPDEDEEDESPREGIAGKIKSLFSRSKSKEVLEDGYDDDEDDDKDKQPKKAENDNVVESVPVAATTQVAEVEDAPVPAPAAEEKKDTVESPVHAPVAVAHIEEDSTEDDDEDERLEDEEPQLKAGIFSSRQEKEDAAVEVELLGRLKELADRVASLKKDEKETNERIEIAKKKEAELKALIIQAHEEHELLDQLAKTRHKEIESEHTAAEDHNFRAFLDSHDDEPVQRNSVLDPLPEFDEEEEPEQRNSILDPLPEMETDETAALPVLHEATVEDKAEEDDEPKDSQLPELKFN